MENKPPKVHILDIETTGLAATDEIVCFIYNDQQYTQTESVSEKDLLTTLSQIVLAKDKINPESTHQSTGPVVTFFGEPKYGATQGFDIPMIRTRYLLNGIPELYPFTGMNHIDLLDIAKKYFNTKTIQKPSIEMLAAAQLSNLAVECGLYPLKTMAANIKQLKEADIPKEVILNFISKNVELKVVEINTLDHIFELFHHKIHESTSGSDVPELFRMYKETGDAQYIKEIEIHNTFCNIKTKHLYECMIESGLVNQLSIPTSRL